MLYYGLDTPVLSDADYEADCKRVIAEWASLTPIRKWQLGSPTDLAATGFHIKATTLAVYAAVKWAAIPFITPTEPWRFSKKHQVYWLPCGSFRIAEKSNG